MLESIRSRSIRFDPLRAYEWAAYHAVEADAMVVVAVLRQRFPHLQAIQEPREDDGLRDELLRMLRAGEEDY